jgi:hypothetical protein
MDRINLIDAVPSTNGHVKPRKASRKAAASGKASKARPMPTHDKLTIAVACVAAASTVLVSMCLNVWAFTHEIGSGLGVAVGLMLPLWVLAATYLGQRMHVRGYKVAMVGAYGLADFMLTVSLPHLAHGYVTVVPAWEGWCLAVVTDLLQVVCKLTVIRVVKSR